MNELEYIKWEVRDERLLIYAKSNGDGIWAVDPYESEYEQACCITQLSSVTDPVEGEEGYDWASISVKLGTAREAFMVMYNFLLEAT